MVQPSKNPDYGQERARTDAGLTGDKVAVGDPAAVPVNTDAETAGTPTSTVLATRSARAQEQIARETRPQAGMAPFASNRQRLPRTGRGTVLIAGSLAVLVAAGLIAGAVSLAAL